MQGSDDYMTRQQEFEGCVSWPYLDSRGNVTVGVGHLLATEAAFLAIPWLPCLTAPSVGWTALNVCRANLPAIEYQGVTALRISDYTAVDLQEADTASVCESILSLWPWAGTLPQPVQDVLIDMGYNLGIGGLSRFPKMLAAMQRADWATAATECERNGVQAARNEWAKAQILSQVTA